jgi:hypothetical protein
VDNKILTNVFCEPILKITKTVKRCTIKQNHQTTCKTQLSSKIKIKERGTVYENQKVSGTPAGSEHGSEHGRLRR